MHISMARVSDTAINVDLLNAVQQHKDKLFNPIFVLLRVVFCVQNTMEQDTLS